MLDANTVAEPSAATTPVQYDSWDEHGTPIVSKSPEPPKKEEPVASVPPTKEAQPEPKGESSAEPGAAPKQEKKEKLSAEERISELVAERNRERKEREKLEERMRNLEAATKPPSEQQPKAPEPLKRPKFADYKTTEEYETAMEKYEDNKAAETRRVAVEEFMRHQQAQESARRIDSMMQKTVEKYPDAKNKVDRVAGELLQKAQLIGAFVGESEVMTDLLYALSDDKTLSNIMEMAKTTPGAALRLLRDMELDIQKELSKPESKTEKETPEHPAKPEAKPPKAPSEVGGRGAPGEDEAIAAARKGDFKSFEAEQWRRLKAAKS